MTSEVSNSRADRLREAIRSRKAAKVAQAGSASDLPSMPEGAPTLASDLQRSIWLAQRLDPESCAYNMVSAFEAPPGASRLEVQHLERALNEVVATHRILRSTFEMVGNRLHQRVLPELSLAVEERVCSVQELESVALGEARRPFDMDRGPLLRMAYLSSEGHSLLLLVVHHLVGDERSLETLWNDFSRAYGGASLDRDRPQAEDYIYWSADQSLRRAEADKEFWCRRLDQLPDPLDWSFAAPALSAGVGLPGLSDEAQPRGKLIRRPLAANTPERVQALAARAGATPFVVYAFAFRLLLHRASRAHRPAFAVPTSTRAHPAAADMVGYFLNPLVMDTDVEDSESIEESLRSFANDFRECLAHGSLPFESLLDALTAARSDTGNTSAPTSSTAAGVSSEQPGSEAGRQISENEQAGREGAGFGSLQVRASKEVGRRGELRQGGRHPLFQTMFVYQESAQPLELGGISLVPRVFDLGESKFELTLFVSETETGPDVAVEFLTERFGQVWMERLLVQYEDLLGQLLNGDAEMALGQVSLVGDAERALLDQWQSPALDVGDRLLLPEVIAERIREQPESSAIVADGESWDFATLGSLASLVAQELADQGVGPGDRVGLFVERSPHLLAALVGCQWAGACYVPIDPSYPSLRNRLILDDAAVAAVLASSKTSERISDLAAPVIVIDELDAAAGRSEPTGDDRSRLGPGRPTSADAPAYILYTSGSTGRPKGVVVSHGNLRASNAARFETYRTAEDSGASEPFVPRRFLLASSVAFDSSVAGIFWTLASGGTLVLPTEDESRDPRSLVRLCAEQDVTSLLCVPSVYAHMLKFQGGASSGAPSQLSTLEVAIVAGENCPNALVQAHFVQLPRTRLFNEYGPTEATVWATASELGPQDADRPVSIGRAIPGVGLRLVDDLGHEVPAGYPGEAWLSGPTIAQGYWRHDHRCAEPFAGLPPAESNISEKSVGSAVYRTGDLMSWTLDGRLLFLGRGDSQVKIRGVRIEPVEVETALRSFEGVRDAAVTTRPRESDRGSHQLVAFVVGDAEIEASLKFHLADRLPAASVPHRLVFLETLPELPNGKVDLRRLQETDLGRESTDSLDDFADEATDIEQGLAALWRGLLGVSGVGLDCNFFELGGHSLLVVEMADAIERDYGVELPAAEIFQRPTVRELARLVETSSDGDVRQYAHLFPLQPGGHGAPFVMAIPHFFSEMLAETFRGKRPVYGLRGVGLRPEGNRGRWPTMATLGKELADETLERFPGEDLIVGGYSFGSSMAFELVAELERRGVRVQKLILIAAMPLDYVSVGPWRLQVPELRRPVGEVSPGQALRRVASGLNPLARDLYRGTKQRFVVKPLRHLLCLWGDLRKAQGLPLTPRVLQADVRLERFRLHRQYRPGSVAAPVVIFNAQEPSTDAAATWRPHFSGPVSIIPTPDPHLSPASKQAAEGMIRSYLEDLE